MTLFDTTNLEEKKDTEEDKPLVMLVDDEVENLSVLKALLDSKYQIITGLNGEEALSMIENMRDPERIQLIISDQRMPKLTGTRFFEKILDRMPHTIRIILTGYSDMDAIMDAINKAQIYKFVTKPFEPPELLLTVKRGIEVYQMRQELEAYTHQLEQMVADRTQELEEKNERLAAAMQDLEQASLTDMLTGAHNRRFMMKFMPQELAQVHRNYHDAENGEPRDLGFLLMDIDHFKKVNDTYGHEAGDLVLKQFVSALKDVCREMDWIVRWGGEEFLIVSRFTGRDQLQTLAERIRKHVEHRDFDIGDGRSISITCSIGLSAYPLSTTSPSALSWENTVNLADLALYRAKNEGRNTWIYLQNNQEGDPNLVYDRARKGLTDCISDGTLLVAQCSQKSS